MEDEAPEHTSDGVTLLAEGRYFKCQKTKLMVCSDYFKAMFTNNFSENNKKIIELQDIDAECLEILVEYVECGSYVITQENVLPLLQTAAMLQFSTVQAACEEQVLSSLSCESCLEVYFVTSTLGIISLASAALTIATWNFESLSRTQQFLQLTVNELQEYIRQPALHPGNSGEWGVWEAVISWIEVCEEERSQHLVKLLLCLDLHALTPEDLANMLFFSVVTDSEEAVQLIECVRDIKKSGGKTAGSVTSDSRTVEQRKRVSVPHSALDRLTGDLRSSLEAALRRPGRRLQQLPCVVGFRQTQPVIPQRKAKGSDDEEDDEHYTQALRIKNIDITPVLFSFDPVQKRIQEELVLSKLYHNHVQCSGYQVCAVGPSFYILGGEYHLGYGNWNNSLWRYSTATKKWISEEALPQLRRHFMACVLNSTIYIMGGFGRHRVILNSMDAFNTRSGKWLKCPSMPHSVSHAAVCAFEGQILVFTQEQLLTFSPRLKTWTGAPLKSPNSFGYRAAVTWKDSVYLIDNCSPQVYRFRPNEGTTVVQYGRFNAPPINVCVVDGTLYNFSHDDLCDDQVVEAMELEEDTHTHTEGGGGGGKLGSVHSKEIWRDNDPSQHLFTTLCPSESTFSLGAFPLLKLRL